MKKNLKVVNGWLVLFVIILIIIVAGFTSYSGFFREEEIQTAYDNNGFEWTRSDSGPNYFKGIISLLVVIFGFISMGGLIVLDPNQGFVATFAGVYKGEFQKNGFWFINPFYGKRKITLRSQNFEIKPLKVNDKSGNPIEIGAVLVFKVEDMYKETFEVEDSGEFLSAQSEAALRRIAGKYEYDATEENGLSSSNEEIKKELIREIITHVAKAGLTIEDANITHLAYAPEIASAMLQKQQAKAIIAARQTIVEGAIGIVKQAVEKVAEDKIADFDEKEKARLVSNLLVVICGEKSPVTTVSLS
jgi:regulator of protease activity HflC (stomatin/prohibitin superfamily)